MTSTVTIRDQSHEYWEQRLRERFDLTGVGYGALGQEYNRMMYRARLSSLERALGAVGRSLYGSRVLEVGCGSGFYTEYCARAQVASYMGLDITSVSVTTLRERYPNYRFVQSDITADQPELDSGFDIVLVADVFFHIVDDAAFAKALRNIASLISANGLLVLSDAFPRATVQPAPHCRHRSLLTYEEQLSMNAFRIKHLEPVFALLHPPLLQPGLSWPWRIYAWSWRYLWRIARWRPLDRSIPVVLSWLDDTILLPRFGRNAPNTKWLLAVRSDVA